MPDGYIESQLCYVIMEKTLREEGGRVSVGMRGRRGEDAGRLEEVLKAVAGR